jgi:hypothetical protein
MMSNTNAIRILQESTRAVIVCSGRIILSTVFYTSLVFQDTHLLPGTTSLSLIQGTITNKDFPALFPFRNASQPMAQHISAGMLLRSVGETGRDHRSA